MRFSPRLQAVFVELCTGKSEKQIARALKTNAHTLHAHAKRIYQLLNVEGRIELMAYVIACRRRGLDPVSEFRRPRRSAPRKHHVGLTFEQRHRLEIISRGQGRSAERTHARVLMGCAAGHRDLAIAATNRISIRTVERIRKKFISHGFEAALVRKPQPPRLELRILDDTARAVLAELAATHRSEGGRPLSHAKLAKRLVVLGHAKKISADTVRRELARM